MVNKNLVSLQFSLFKRFTVNLVKRPKNPPKKFRCGLQGRHTKNPLTDFKIKG